MTVEKQTSETLSVEVERNGKKAASKCTVPSSSRQLYVQVKKRKLKRQYRRNQDAINFLRRFTLAVVIIDLILAISETSLISTFFLFLTLSTTFDVKPENVVDTYCYHFQGGGNTMCEQYMEHLTDFTTPPSSPPPSAMNHHHRSSANSPNSPSENHFPTVPTRTPLSPSESRKLFLAYNQSLYESPIRFNFAQKIDKDSKLSRAYARLVYLLFESHNGILNETQTLSEFLKNEANNLDEKVDSESSKISQKILLESLISKQVKQTIEVIAGTGAPISLPSKANSILLFRLCAKTLERLKSAQKAKQRRLKEEKQQQQQQQQQQQSVNPPNQAVNPFRKNLIQPTDFVRHRWKRNAFIPSVPSIDPSETEKIGSKENELDQIMVEHDFDETTDMPGATGSIQPMEGESGGTTTVSDDHDSTVQQQQKEKQGNKISALSRTKATARPRGSGYRLVKSGNGSSNNNKKVTAGDIIEEQGQILADDNFYDASKVRAIRTEGWGYNKNENGMTNQSAQYYVKRDVPMIFTIAEGNMNEFTMNKVHTKQKSNAEGNNGAAKSPAPRDDQAKYLDQFLLALQQHPKHILSLMEVALFNNWPHFIEEAKRLAIFYQVDHREDLKNVKDPDDSVIFISLRQKVMENLLLNMETTVFGSDTLRKAGQRKKAIEQLYHDYSSSILGELKNVKEMSVSRSFHTIYWVIKLYVLVWQLTICMVLLFGSIFEDKTALNIWGIFSILTSLLHFMVDDWINTSFQPEKTSASIWFGVIYGVYKPITILLVATLSSEIFKKDGGKKRGVLARICEIIRGRKRPPLILADKCLDKLKGLFITPEPGAEVEGGDKKGAIATVTSENNNGSIVYKGIRTVKIRAKIKQMEINNGSLIVITQSGSTQAENTACKDCSVCGSPSATALACSSTGNENEAEEEEEKVHELRLFQPCAPLDNEAGLTTEDLYPEDTDDEEEDDDELEEVVDEDDDESDEEEEGDAEQCTHPDHERNIMMQASHHHHQPCTNPACTNEGRVPGTTMESRHADMVVLSETNKAAGGGCSAAAMKNGQSGLSLIACAGNAIQGNLLLDSNPQAIGKAGQQQGDELLHGPIVDGGNLHI